LNQIPVITVKLLSNNVYCISHYINKGDLTVTVYNNKNNLLNIDTHIFLTI